MPQKQSPRHAPGQPYSRLVQHHLAELRPVLASAIEGDFSKNLTIPDADDDFTELFRGVQNMVEVIRTQMSELRELNQTLEERARERSAALEEAQALTHLGSWQWDVASNVITWSDELYRIYGLRPQERQVSFDEFIGFIHPDDRERIQSTIYEVFQSGSAFNFVHRVIHPDGQVRTLRGIGKVVRDGEGTPLRMLGTSQDITDREAAQQALQKSDERFRTVTKATHDLVYDLDLASRTIWFNEAIHNDYGYIQGEIDNSFDWWARRIHPDDLPSIRHEILNVRTRRDQQWQSEFRFQKADKKYVVVRNRAFVLYDQAGEPERIIGSLLDITAQKQLEHAKDEFLSLVSHQLRTPLTVTRLYSEMLSSGVAGPITPDQQAYVSRITGASVRMIHLVSEILNISRVELDRIKVQPVPTDINRFIQIHLKELTPLAREKGVRLEFTPDTDLPLIPIDSDVFNLIVENLLANAVRYTRQDEGRVSVSFNCDEKGCYVLAVRDNGIGIPAAARPYIFSRFYRADNAVNFDSEGTGLGLYLIKLICDTIGAETWFESKKNRGTTFYVKLPPCGMVPRQGRLALEKAHD
ncbi:PAS domain-containing protein [Candidatus Saccharibacteria bacterium]|nr:PAS domain-containing protein [Candidatus Saccharibacteria bacterium]